MHVLDADAKEHFVVLFYMKHSISKFYSIKLVRKIPNSLERKATYEPTDRKKVI